MAEREDRQASPAAGDADAPARAAGMERPGPWRRTCGARSLVEHGQPRQAGMGRGRSRGIARRRGPAAAPDRSGGHCRAVPEEHGRRAEARGQRGGTRPAAVDLERQHLEAAAAPQCATMRRAHAQRSVSVAAVAGSCTRVRSSRAGTPPTVVNAPGYGGARRARVVDRAGVAAPVDDPVLGPAAAEVAALRQVLGRRGAVRRPARAGRRRG